MAARVSSMGHPGTLLPSQVVAIQWYLLQERTLLFVVHVHFIGRSSSEHISTCVCRAGEFTGWSGFGYGGNVLKAAS